MNSITIFLLLMALLGFIDKFLGDKWGLLKPFNDGIALIGELLIYIIGLYCVGLTIARGLAGNITAATTGWFFDPSILAGSILASDLGGYPISITLAQDPLIGRFSGVVIAGTLGILISFYLPVYLGELTRDDSYKLTLGFIFGIIVLPITMILGGLLIGIAPLTLIKNLIPVLIFCCLLLVGLLRARDITVKVLSIFGKSFRILTFGSFFVVMVGLLFPNLALIDRDLAVDAVVMVAKMGIIISGSLVMVELVRRLFKKQLDALSAGLHINDWSLLGMLVAMPAGIAMLPLFPKMDSRGKVLNGAFAVSGHYLLGGTMAFISSVEPFHSLLVFFFVKIVGGILAVALATFYLKNFRGANYNLNE